MAFCREAKSQEDQSLGYDTCCITTTSAYARSCYFIVKAHTSYGPTCTPSDVHVKDSGAEDFFVRSSLRSVVLRVPLHRDSESE